MKKDENKCGAYIWKCEKRMVRFFWEELQSKWYGLVRIPRKYNLPLDKERKAAC